MVVFIDDRRLMTLLRGLWRGGVSGIRYFKGFGPLSHKTLDFLNRRGWAQVDCRMGDAPVGHIPSPAEYKNYFQLIGRTSAPSTVIGRGKRFTVDPLIQSSVTNPEQIIRKLEENVALALGM